MTETTVRAAAPARWQDYVALMKPRVMSLVVFTALTGLVCAAHADEPGAGRRSPSSASPSGPARSGALNMWFDADIDALMRRTRAPAGAGRPRAARRRPGPRRDLSLFSVGLMALATNLLAAGLLAFTIFFYAVVYTMLAQALDAAEHRHRRPGRRPAAGGRLGRGQRDHAAERLAAGGHHLRVDAAALLGAVALHRRRLRRAPACRCCRWSGARRRRAAQILVYSLVLVAAGAGAGVRPGLGGVVYLAVAAAGGVIFLILAGRLAGSQAGDEAGGAEGLYQVKAAEGGARPVRLLDPLPLRPVRRPAGRAVRRRLRPLHPMSEPPRRPGLAARPDAGAASPSRSRWAPSSSWSSSSPLRGWAVMSPPSASDRRRRANARMALLCVACVLVVMVGVAFAAVPLYRAFCQATGFNGAVPRAKRAPTRISAQTVTVGFDTNVRGLPWAFAPRAASQTLHVGRDQAGLLHGHQHRPTAADRPGAYNVTPERGRRLFLQAASASASRTRPSRRTRR